MARIAFGTINGVVQRKFATGIERKHFEQAAQSRLRRFPLNQRCSGDRAGVDHWIARPASAWFEADGIEGVARWLSRNFAQHVLPAVVLQGEAVHERLGNRLYRERLQRVANFIDVACCRDETNAEPFW